MFESTFATARRGVTPVVGIVLLVGITVLLAATVGAFAFGLEDSSQRSSAPNVAFGVDYDHVDGGNDELSITHTTGDSVLAENLYVVVQGATCEASGDDPNGRYPVTDFHSGPLRAGMTFQIDGSTSVTCSADELNLRGASVRIVWESGVATSRTYRTWDGPG